MTAATIEVPAQHVEAVRQSLLGYRGQADPAAIADLLAQLAAGPGVATPQQLTGPRSAIWDALYDALCLAAEQLLDDCTEYWRGGITPTAARRRVRDVTERLELLIGLGAPPGAS